MKSLHLLLVSASLALATQVHAQDRILYWNGSTDSNWSTAANWDELSSDASLSAAGSAPVSGDVVVLIAGQTNNPSNNDIVGLELEGLWFGPSVDTIALNGNDIGLVAGGNDFLPADLVGSMAFDIDLINGVTTYTLIDTNLDTGPFLNDITAERTAFLLATQAGSTFTQNGGNPQFEESIASFDAANGTVTVSVAPTFSETNRRFVLGSRFDLNVDIYLVGNDGQDVQVWIGQEDDGTLTLDNAFEVNPNNAVDAVGLDFGGDDGANVVFQGSFGFNYLGDVELLNTNNTFLGPIVSSFTGGDITLASIGPSGDITAAGQGDTLELPGNTDSNTFSLSGNFTTDRILDSNRNGFQLNNNANITWTGPITLGGGSSAGARIQNFSVFNLGNNAELNLFADVVSTFSNSGIGYIGSSSGRVNIEVDQTDTSPLFIENVQYAVRSFGVDGASGGLGAGEFIQMNGGADIVYNGTTDATLTRFILTTDGNTAIVNESTATLTIDNLFESRRTGNVRGNTFDAVNGPIVFDGDYYNVENGEQTVSFQSSTGQSISVIGPVGNNHETSLGNNSPSGSEDDSTDFFMTVTAAANPDVVTTVTGAPTGSGNITFEVASVAGIMPGMLVIADFVDDPQTTVNSVNTTDSTVTVSDDGDGSLAISDTVTFLGFQPLGYDDLVIRNGTYTINTTLTNVDRDGGDGGAIQFGAGGSSDQIIQGDASFVPMTAGETVFAQFGNLILRPGNSIGTMNFGSGATPLGNLELNDVTFELEISGDQVDTINAWADSLQTLTASDIVLTNIGASSPATGDFTVFSSLTGTEIPAIPSTLTLSGNFTNRTVTLTDNGDEFGFGVTEVILSIEFTQDATTAFDDFVAAIPGITDTGPDSDEDNDGSSLAAEFIANTDPTDSSDAPVISFEFVMVGSDEFPAIRFTRPTDQVLAPTVGEVDDDLSTGPDFAGPPSTVLESSGTPFTGTGGVEYEEVLFRSNVTTAADEDQFLRVNGELILPE
ncbi:MAG: beta strand repeat-containing protein [Opitutales bacterium]